MRLTSIRGIACVIVLMHHAMLLFQVNGHRDVLNLPLQFADRSLLIQQILLVLFDGPAAVTLFFVLSGCVLSLSLQNVHHWSLATTGGFYVKRAFRILPTLWLAVLVSYLLLPLNFGSPLPDVSSHWMATAYTRWPSAYDLVRHFIGMESFLDQPLWSLFIELFYSVVFPVIFILTRGASRAAAMVLVSILILFVPIQIRRDLNFYLFAFVLGSSIGALGSSTAAVGPKERTLSSEMLLLSAAGAITVLLGTRRVIEPFWGPTSVVIFCETCAAGVIIYVALFAKTGLRWLESTPLLHLGNISFSVYLLHFPILFLIARCLGGLLGSNFILLHPIVCNSLVGVASLLLIIPIASVTFRWFEQPLQQLGRGAASKLYLLAELDKSATKSAGG